MHAYPSYLQPLSYYRQQPQAAIIARAHEAKKQGKKIVIASGVFDLLHDAHKEFLRKAKEVGQWLIVLIESDARTKELKGSGRPIWKQDQRKAELLKLDFIDDVLILPAECDNPQRWEETVILLAPDIYAVSSNSTALEAKSVLMEKYGGKLAIVLEEIPGLSTTQLLKNTTTGHSEK